MPNRGSKIGPRGWAQYVPGDEPKAIRARCTRTQLVVTLSDRRVLHVPLDWFDRLKNAKPKDLRRVKVHFSGQFISLSDAQEDISVTRLLMPTCAACLAKEWENHRRPESHSHPATRVA